MAFFKQVLPGLWKTLCASFPAPEGSLLLLLRLLAGWVPSLFSCSCFSISGRRFWGELPSALLPWCPAPSAHTATVPSSELRLSLPLEASLLASELMFPQTLLLKWKDILQVFRAKLARSQ